MATDYFFTIRAFPFFLFSFQKFCQNVFFNIPKIVNHIHTVMYFITFGKVFYEFAGKLVAFIAEFHLVIQKLFAFFLKKRALLVSGAATFAVRQFDSFSFSIVF